VVKKDDRRSVGQP